MRPHSFAVLLLVLPLAAAAATLGGGGDPRAVDLGQTFDFDAAPEATVGTYVATQAEGKLKGIRRVAITNFCVQFVDAKGASAASSGSWVEYSRSSTGSIPGGLDPVKMQAVADGLLDRIEKDMRAAGIEIVPDEELAANELYRKFTAKYDTGIRVATRQLEAGKGGATTEVVVYVSPRGRPFASDCGTISPQSTGTFVRMSYPLNAEFLTGSAVIDLGKASAGGKLFAQAKADIQLAEFLRPGESQYQFVGKMGPGARLWLKQAIVPANNPFAMGEVGEAVKTTTTEDVGIDRTVTTRSTSSSQSVAFDEALYYDNAARSLEAMHRMFMLKVTGAR